MQRYCAEFDKTFTIFNKTEIIENVTYFKCDAIV